MTEEKKGEEEEEKSMEEKVMRFDGQEAALGDEEPLDEGEGKDYEALVEHTTKVEEDDE